jgi:Kef-type K+ transport system membrane component KefB
MTPVPPLSSAELLTLLVQLATLLVIALGLGRIAARLGMPAIVGELLAGVLLGPSVLGHSAPPVYHWLFPATTGQQHLLDAVGQFGVILLVGVAGAHLDVASLPRRGTTALRVSAFGLLLPLASGATAGYFAPVSLMPHHNRVVFGAFVAVAMSVTAIPVIAKTLADMRLLHREVGQLTLTAGMIDDAVAWFLLSVVSAMATVGLRRGPLTLSVLYLVGFVAVAVLLGRPLVRAVMRLAGRSSESGPSITAAVVLVLVGAAVTQALHMEAVFGAFVVGILIGAPGVVEPKRLAPLRTIVLSVLAPIFLASAGLRMDLTTLANPVVLLAALAALAIAIVGKFTGAYVGARVSRLGHWEGVAVGAGMNARGVVEIVVAMVGLRLGVLNVTSYTIVALIAIVTSLMAPPLLRLAMSRVSQNAEEQLRLTYQESWAATERPPDATQAAAGATA